MTQLQEIMHRMMQHDAGSAHRIQHFMKVYEFATLIAECEGIDPITKYTLQVTALMHDCGIKPALEKYKSSGAMYQQKEGPIVAREILQDFDIDQGRVDRVCYLIANHHNFTNIDGMDYQILVEADFLVNLYESNASIPQIVHTRSNIFKTRTGLYLLDLMFLPQMMKKK